ncbi:MAG: N-acetyl-gamma-glutamyl-phosphate reductase [Pseudomonadales bacterium]|nr:N-acetyl-gamma-glutamyl-phosphate reductase [Pseudomonadales bacterium]
MIQVGIVGGTGYTGVELLRLLANHPEATPSVITSRSEDGLRVDELYPNLRGHLDLAFSKPDVKRLSECDLVFFATPHGVAMEMAPELIAAGTKVVDLSADFRLQDTEQFKQWYGMEHSCPDLLKEAAYGLPELNRAAITGSNIVAVPGCYPTAVQLGFAPLLAHDLVDTSRLIADAKSGVSGAGRQGKIDNLLCETTESMKAYAVPGHRHLPEIVQGLERISEHSVGLTFVPHLTPMIRGIHATLYSTLTQSPESLQELFEQRYANEPFVDVMPTGSHPQTRSVKGSNHCRISVHQPQNQDVVVVLSVIDNLVKGAAGQAVQNMNILCGLEETCGLTQVALMP